MMRGIRCAVVLLAWTASSHADVGDPQIKTDHPWYAGELSCSTFERLFATQAGVYRRVTGREIASDEDKVLASWLWRNTHYWHGEEGGQDLWGKGFGQGQDVREREYWTGLFAHGFSLCGTTHSQWVGEMEALLGHGRGRSVGTAGHNSFEVFLTGGQYGKGRWALLDHDLSTVVFTPSGDRLMGIAEIAPDWKRLADRRFAPKRQHGWLPAGLHADDAASFAAYGVAEYLSGYAGPPPTVHLRRGETLRRYVRPGLEDGKTFVFWGRNYNVQGIAGPERSRTWVNQPEKMYQSKTGTSHVDGQARHANAVYTYRPDFRSEDYREGVVDEDDRQVTFQFTSPYIIAATPAGDGPWDVYKAGCTNGLTLSGRGDAKVSVSVDRGGSWAECGRLGAAPDLTDRVKGHRQYWLRFHASAKELADSGLTITTVCQCNSSVLPQLIDNGSEVVFEVGRQATVSAGPNVPLAARHLVAGRFGTPALTMSLATPKGESIRAVYAAAHVQSGSPPDPKIRYRIEYSLDGGRRWQSLASDWTITRQGSEPPDFWSQSLCWGDKSLKGADSQVQVRFRNDGGKPYARAELHLVYETPTPDATKVTFAWDDRRGRRTHSHVVRATKDSWSVPTDQGVRTRWVEFEVLAGGAGSPAGALQERR